MLYDECVACRYMGSGGAAVSLPVLQFFEDIGIPIAEGYGLTETGWQIDR